MNKDYEWQIRQLQTQKKELPLTFPYEILEKKENKYKVKFKLLTNKKAYITGSFNNWSKDKSSLKEFQGENRIKTLTIWLEHKDKYKFLVDDNLYQDPSAIYFDDEGNSVFWVLEKKPKYDFINTKNRSHKILQTDLPGLIVHFKDNQGTLGSDIPKREYYKFIKNSGIIPYIKELGFNTIQFLPFAQNIDGDNWKFRYLVPFQFAIQKNWGSPDDFLEMIDEFHKHDIAVIGDFVLGHIPHKDYKIFGLDSDNNGIHVWQENNQYTYLKDTTSWGTMRINYDDELVRKYFIESCLFFQKNYKIDGFRIDNVDGIIRYGDNGDGDERPNGRVFLRELNSAIYEQNPFSLIHFEAHYFYEDNAKLLVAPLNSSNRALGATAYNSSRLTYYFHRDYMLKSADKITPWKFKHITDEKEWGKSNSTIADFHNHDAAAGLMDQRATGSYAYDAMAQRPENHIHALGKIKVMEAIISFCAEGRTLDLAQTFLLQTGTFEHDSSIRWQLTFNQVSKNLLNYKTKVNNILDEPAFFPENVHNREFLNVDDKNKILVVQRSCDKESFLIIINLSSYRLLEYKVGVTTKNDFELILNSDLFNYSGFGLSSLPNSFEPRESKNFELLDKEIVLPLIAPYQVIVLKEKK